MVLDIWYRTEQNRTQLNTASVFRYFGAGSVAAPVAGLSDCEVAQGFAGKYFVDTNYDFIDLYSVSVIAEKCAISCYMGPRYNGTLVISFIKVMPVFWRVRVCVCAELVGCIFVGENWPR